MKLSLVWRSMLTASILSSAVFAQDSAMMWGSLGLGLWFVTFVVVIACLIFWVQMLIDAIKHQEENKVLWIILIALGNTIWAIVYYFAAKKPRVESERNLQSQPTEIMKAPILDKEYD